MFQTLSLDFFLTLGINMIAILVLVYGCYLGAFFRRRHTKVSAGTRDHAIAFLLFGVGVFIVTALLHSVDLSMGFAFGLFAVFSMLRYRTESISVKEMTYLFLVIAMSLLSAVGPLNPVELTALHTVICASAWLCDGCWLTQSGRTQRVEYELIDNLRPERRAHLWADLSQRTGLVIQHIDIVQLDFVRDTATLDLTYTASETPNAKPDTENLTKCPMTPP